jgi:tetratricopeptide (TPR) repeat protein
VEQAMLKWLDAREATDVGAALADDFVLQSASGSAARQKSGSSGAAGRDLQKFMQKFLQRVDRDARPLQLNLFKRAKLANSFKWRLLEKGVEKTLVEELTQALVLRLTADPHKASAAGAKPDVLAAGQPVRGSIQSLLSTANDQMARGAYAEATSGYGELLSLDPRNAVARNNLGAALIKLGRYREAEDQFRRAIGIRPGYADAQCNLGTVLRLRGEIAESELPLRRARKLRPVYVEAQVSLAVTLVLLGRLHDARDLFEKALKLAPRNIDALVGVADIAAHEGRFNEAETFFKRALEVDPKATTAWAGLMRLRRMTPADNAWLKSAEAVAHDGLAPLDEATIRFAIGKFCDDVGDFARAFRSYQRANELQKTLAEPYDAEARVRFVDDLIRIYTPEALAGLPKNSPELLRPVLVVGMPRSGTSLVEQIIASHPKANGAGEQQFWSDAVRKHLSAVRRGLLEEPLRKKLGAAYLRVLGAHCPGALRVVDKSTFNADFLGIIYSALPNARVIYVRRDAIDSCLSCYFQPFSAALNFTLDLSDLAHYYREHQRLVAHWRSALPPGTLLDVPYEDLITDQERWTRRIVEFIGLDWDERCLDFHKTDRPVLTASYVQVRQKIYKSSVGRWRNYEKFIGPLLELKGRD